jgi:hypothetical protein
VQSQPEKMGDAVRTASCKNGFLTVFPAIDLQYTGKRLSILPAYISRKVIKLFCLYLIDIS